MNLEADQVSLVLQVGAYMTVEIEHIVQRDGEILPASLFDLAQPNCYRYGASVEPSIFVGVITIPELRRIRSEVVNDEFSFSQIPDVLDK